MNSKFIAWISSVPTGFFFWKVMAGVMAYAAVVLWFDDSYFPKQKFLEVDGIMTTSVVMGVLFVFRTNSAYDRWWEGRKVWGQLVNDIRNLSLKSTSYLSSDKRQQETLACLLIAFPYALRDHLRKMEPSPQVALVISSDKHITHIPLELAEMIFELVYDWAETKTEKFDLLLLDPHMRSLMEICGACERIQKTPIARAYKEMIWCGLGIYTLILPWLLVPTIDIWTLPVVFVGAYFVFTLELLAEEVEEPFGTNSNDLPLDTICKTIEDSVRQAFAHDTKAILPEPIHNEA